MAPLPRVLVAFITGLLLTCYNPLAFGQQATVLISFASMTLTYIVLSLMAKQGKATSTFGVMVYIFALTLGLTRGAFSHYGMQNNKDSKERIVRAVVTNNAVEKKNTFAVNIDCGKNGGKQIVYLWSEDDSPLSLQPGDSIRFVPQKTNYVVDEIERMKKEKEKKYLGYQWYLYYSHINATQFSSRWWTTKKKDSHNGFHWGRLRRRMSEKYVSLQLPSEERAILTAMTLGDKKGMQGNDKNISSDFSRAGVSHVLALSGFHLTIIYALLDMLFLTSFFHRRRKWIPNIIVIACLWAYTFLADTPPSLVRAAAMCTIISVAKSIYGGRQSSLDALILSAFIMLMYDPFYLMNISFQLSYASMLGITLASPMLSQLQVSINKTSMTNIAKKIVTYFSGIILISVIATIATAGIVAYHFSSISLIGVATNICVSVLASILMIAAVVWWILQLFWGITTLDTTSIAETLNSFMGMFLHWLLKGMLQTVEFFASFPHATLSWSPSLLEMSLYYIALFTTIWGIINWKEIPNKFRIRKRLKKN